MTIWAGASFSRQAGASILAGRSKGARCVAASPAGSNTRTAGVDDARLVVLNALDAARLGAEVLTRTAAVRAQRHDGCWQVELEDRTIGGVRRVLARCLVNAAGPWVEQVLADVAGVASSRRVRLVKGSHIVTRKFWEGPHAYLLQNTDRRVVFVMPYEDELALIGTTDVPVELEPKNVAVENHEVDYLLAVLRRYSSIHPPRRTSSAASPVCGRSTMTTKPTRLRSPATTSSTSPLEFPTLARLPCCRCSAAS